MRKLLYFVLLAAGFAACKKDNQDDTTPTPTPKPTTQNYNVSFTLNGSKKSFVDMKNGFEHGVSSDLDLAPFPDPSSGSYSSYIYSNLTGEALDITKGIISFQGSSPDDADFKNFFAPGSYSYATSPSTSGIVILYNDDNGVDWSTGNGTQSGSVFTITSVKELSVWGTYYLELKGTFSCTVYNNLGDSKTITNGSFYLSVGNI